MKGGHGEVTLKGKREKGGNYFTQGRDRERVRGKRASAEKE